MSNVHLLRPLAVPEALPVFTDHSHLPQMVPRPSSTTPVTLEAGTLYAMLVWPDGLEQYLWSLDPRQRLDIHGALTVECLKVTDSAVTERAWTRCVPSLKRCGFTHIIHPRGAGWSVEEEDANDKWTSFVRLRTWSVVAEMAGWRGRGSTQKELLNEQQTKF
jgi:hypothetical protein